MNIHDSLDVTSMVEVEGVVSNFMIDLTFHKNLFMLFF